MPLIEADVHLFAGRLEVRHLKTLGPVPILWDRWQLAPPWSPRLLLERLLDAVQPSTELMLDLKGSDKRLAPRVASALEEHAPGGRVTVCSQNWRLLEPMRGSPGVRVVHSVGSRRGLQALHRRFAGTRLEGVSIHRKLLDRSAVARLRERAALVLAWPVTTLDEGMQLASWGVDGLICQRFEAIAPALAEATTMPDPVA